MRGGRGDAIEFVAAFDKAHPQTAGKVPTSSVSQCRAVGAHNGRLAVVARDVDRLRLVADVLRVEAGLRAAKVRRDAHDISAVGGSVTDDVQHEILLLMPQPGRADGARVVYQDLLGEGEELDGDVAVVAQACRRQPAAGERVEFLARPSPFLADEFDASPLTDQNHWEILGGWAASVGSCICCVLRCRQLGAGVCCVLGGYFLARGPRSCGLGFRELRFVVQKFKMRF